MGSNLRLRILVILVFIGAGALLYFAFLRMQQNVSDLVTSVKEASRPDSQLMSIKEMWTTFSDVGYDVKAFSVTRDQKYLVTFLDKKDQLLATIDSLKKLNNSSGKLTSSFDSLELLFNHKAAIYENLLDISYNKVIGEAVQRMNKSEPEIDTSTFMTEDGNLVQRMFSSKYSRRSIKARADSILKEQNNRQLEYKKNIKLIRLEEERLLKVQSDRELELLGEDTKVTASIEQIILKLENEERLMISSRIENSKIEAEATATVIRQMIIGGVAIILLLLLFVLIEIEIAGRRKKELVASRLKAEKLAHAREDFIATMSHEIRTPLTSVIGFSDKLSDTILDTDQQRYLGAIKGSSNHLLAVVNDVLDFTRIETGKLKFDAISFKPYDVFAEVYSALKWKADEKRIKLNLFGRTIMDIVLFGDPVRLKQVIFNLAGNAIKFTDKGSVDLNVSFIRESENEFLLFKIIDTGIGIPAEKLETIFEEYEQASASTERAYGGTGLGLAISRKIISQLGGVISVDSNPGLGSVFSVKIPYKRGDENDAETSFTEDRGEKLFENKTFILAEDDALIRELQSKNLEDAGANVYVANNGKEALELFRQHDADLLILDIQMPELSGPEAVKIIRKDFTGKKQSVPVIAMTANILQHDLKRYMEAGMSDFITKPFRDTELFEKINKLLNVQNAEVEVEKVPAPVIIENKPEFVSKRPEPGNKPYDLQDLIATSNGNHEFTRRMINLFLTSSYASVNNLKFHLKQNNPEQLGKTAHRMIGSYKQMGSDHVAVLLKELEEACYDDQEKGKSAWLVTEIEKYSLEIFDSLKKELDNY